MKLNGRFDQFCPILFWHFKFDEFQAFQISQNELNIQIGSLKKDQNDQNREKKTQSTESQWCSSSPMFVLRNAKRKKFNQFQWLLKCAECSPMPIEILDWINWLMALTWKSFRFSLFQFYSRSEEKTWSLNVSTR